MSDSVPPHGLCSPPGSSIHGIFQARGLEWGATAFSDGWCGQLQTAPHHLHPSSEYQPHACTQLGAWGGYRGTRVDGKLWIHTTAISIQGKDGKNQVLREDIMPVEKKGTQNCVQTCHTSASLTFQPSTHSLTRMCKYVCSLGNPQFTKEFSFFFFNKNFISQYFSVPGFPIGSFCNFILFSGCTDQVLNPGHSHEKPRILTTRPPGNSPEGFLLKGQTWLTGGEFSPRMPLPRSAHRKLNDWLVSLYQFWHLGGGDHRGLGRWQNFRTGGHSDLAHPALHDMHSPCAGKGPGWNLPGPLTPQNDHHQVTCDIQDLQGRILMVCLQLGSILPSSQIQNGHL